jgi:hypothetical protein
MPREYGTLFFLQDLNRRFFHSFTRKGAGFLQLNQGSHTGAKAQYLWPFEVSEEAGDPDIVWAATYKDSL